MAMVKQLYKRSGITYVYESVSYWNLEKKQPRSKRTLIGRLDPATGKIVPTDGRGKRRAQKEADPVVRKGPISVDRTDRIFFGTTYLLDQIGEVTGLTADLKTCFPNTYKQIQSIAYYLVLEDQNPLFCFKKWAAIHRHILKERIFHLSGAQRSFRLLRKKSRCISSGYRENAGWRKSIGHMTAPPFQADPRH